MAQFLNPHSSQSLAVTQEESGLGINTTSDFKAAAVGACQLITFLGESSLLKKDLGGAPSWLKTNFMSKHCLQIMYLVTISFYRL